MAFTDKTGDRWDTSLDGFLYLRLKREIGVDVFKLFASEDGLPSLLADVEKLIDSIWIICEEQAVDRKIDETGFAKRIGPETLSQAADSLVASIVDFLPTPEQREAAWAVIGKAKEAGTQILETVTESFRPPTNLKTSSGETQG